MMLYSLTVCHLKQTFQKMVNVMVISFFFLFQDLKNQILTTNLWVETVSGNYYFM